MTGPLAGLRVLVPRPPGRATALTDLLTGAGAEVEAAPLIGFDPPADPGRLDLTVLDLAAGSYDWVAFTSVTAVDAVLARATALSVLTIVPADTRIAVVGRSTAAAVRAAGLPVDLQPAGAGSAAELGRAWPAGTGSVVLPRSALAPADLPEALRGKGWTVMEVEAYRTTVHPLPAALDVDLRSGAVDAVLLTSTSTATALSSTRLGDGVVVVAIGAATAAAATAAGIPVHRIADRPSDSGLVDALLAAVRTRAAALSSPDSLPDSTSTTTHPTAPER